MNGKKAKKIRQAAQKATTGNQKAEYMMQTNENLQDYRCIRLRPECTRNVTNVLKKEYLRGIR